MIPGAQIIIDMKRPLGRIVIVFGVYDILDQLRENGFDVQSIRQVLTIVNARLEEFEALQTGHLLTFSVRDYSFGFQISFVA